ncbi:3-hydroxyisobutyrate dehydrogenase-like beta-hydroxyacid dehydrogenase [Microbacterium natoriense]|uniref:3-hydroxyisobutyrate dehydrogenase-like beta-hydroxyacid dehydrogenase n=1 Tax=Microbacterium natoriense TaxID=284570 RepID=A0AAW8EYZ4_9MICO|nr:3-hydroxyisobutyrate dehydrogenase-like beta-hydroxyacid dehydrogenase [Microbacterium natoriense]
MTAYVGADAHDPILAQIRALDLFRTIIACGPVGQGMALKLVNQAVHMVNLCALVDGAALAGALGLDPVLTMRGLAAGSAASTMLERFGDAIFLGADKAQFSAALARKDLDNVLESWALVPGTDGSLTMVAEAQAVVAGAIQRLGTDIDVSAIGRRGCE